MALISTSLQLIKYNFSNPDQIIQILEEDSTVAEAVEAIEKTNHVINVRKAMVDLTVVGKSLQLAYAASKGFKCCVDVTKIFTSYQSLVKNSTIACGSFVTGSLVALKQHVVAIKFATKSPKMTLQALAKCAAQASNMATISDNLAKEAEQLVNLSTSALLKAVEESSLTKDKKEEVLKSIADLKAKEAGLKTTTKILEERLEKQQKDQKEIMNKLGKAKTGRLLCGMAKFVVTPLTKACEFLPKIIGDSLQGSAAEVKRLQKEIGDVQKSLAEDQVRLVQAQKNEDDAVGEISAKVAGLRTELSNKQQELAHHQSFFEKLSQEADSEVRSLEESHRRVQEKREEMENQQLEARKELAESVVRLQSTYTTSDQLDRAVRCLDITTKTLGQIKTTFENARVYWKSVERHCTLLTDHDTIKAYLEAEMTEDFTKEITDSALQWLSLANTNRTALLAIGGVNRTVDNAMSNLPTTGEAMFMIGEVSTDILAQITG